MDAARLSQKVFAEYGKAARRVGALHDVYRPASSGAVIAPANKIATLNAAFTIHGPSNFDFTRPSDYDKPLFHLLGDPSSLRVGDYLNDPAHPFGPFFVALITPAMPPLAVNCNRVVSFLSPGPACPAPGVSGYGGTVGAAGSSNETPLLTSWPASLLRRRVTTTQYLPQDAGQATFETLIPAYGAVALKQGVVMTDDLGARYVVQMAEKQDLGWRLEVIQETL